MTADERHAWLEVQLQQALTQVQDLQEQLATARLADLSTKGEQSFMSLDVFKYVQLHDRLGPGLRWRLDG